ncbi:MAG: RNA polymerase factor sigma-54 [Candidatus Marinimicrobia bacterium]|nr:RNA polymerase factor sigma-54 [Candidatus Neomarinimicrobiota bacterium]MCH8068139.1 RNA polymerase factor sigma-54 [Candidatus Neomarinimicrobiota bacterium]
MVELRQTLELQQKLTPQQVLQTILLQLNTIDLQDRITEELEENPMLEMKEPESQEPSTEDDSKLISDLEEMYNSPEDFRIRTRYEKPSERQDIPIPQRVDPTEKLLNQIRLLDLDDTEVKIAEEIAWNIDERGYLATDVEIIADRIDEDIERVENILKIVQRLNPVGIGARDLQECLRIQLEENGSNQLALEIISDYFDDFANKRFEKLKSALKCNGEELNEAMKVISHLNPVPGEGSPTTDAEIIVPDIIVEEVDGELVISVNDTSLPELQLSPVYMNLLSSGNRPEPEVRTFLRKKVDSAKWFINAVQQRHITMINVMKAIIQRQKEFFSGNTSLLSPMILKDVAEIAGVDVSTVSRVTRRKYAQTPYGLFRLKHFFSEGLITESGEEVSRRLVKEELKKLIESEDKHQPLADDKLAEMMKERGYAIARRTVAKYREQMKIPVARLRREL